MQGGLWGQLVGVEIVKPQPDEIAFIGQAYQRILDTQKADAGDAAGLRRIAAELQRRDGVEAILMAGTDLAVMFDETTAGFPAIDVARLHIDAIVEHLANDGATVTCAEMLVHLDDRQGMPSRISERGDRANSRASRRTTLRLRRLQQKTTTPELRACSSAARSSIGPAPRPRSGST